MGEADTDAWGLPFFFLKAAQFLVYVSATLSCYCVCVGGMVGRRDTETETVAETMID